MGLSSSCVITDEVMLEMCVYVYVFVCLCNSGRMRETSGLKHIGVKQKLTHQLVPQSTYCVAFFNHMATTHCLKNM